MTERIVTHTIALARGRKLVVVEAPRVPGGGVNVYRFSVEFDGEKLREGISRVAAHEFAMGFSVGFGRTT